MKFPKWMYWVILLIGVLYLIRDIMYWRYWWSLSWWTAAFLVIGVGGLLSKKEADHRKKE
ncbi:hypothetical protein JXB28_01835 [Candidatus Woesearchaeota archaeon]|nr:hypothetical protein [Candidatus Woesearchaeota archaeon]